MSYKKTVDMRSVLYAVVALLLALGLHFLGGAIPSLAAGWELCQIPILLAGFAAGPLWGGICGALFPLLLSALTGSFSPYLLRDVAEFSIYAVAAAYFFRYLPKKTFPLYLSLICAQFFGRLAWGGMQLILCLFLSQISDFHWTQITAATVANSTNGILLQLLILPPMVMGMQKAKWISRY